LAVLGSRARAIERDRERERESEREREREREREELFAERIIKGKGNKQIIQIISTIV
jgi:hypothetical protein